MYIIETYAKLHVFYMLYISRNYTGSAENQFDLKMAFKVFFSLVILVGNTLPIKNPTDDTLSSLSNQVGVQEVKPIQGKCLFCYLVHPKNMKNE